MRDTEELVKILAHVILLSLAIYGVSVAYGACLYGLYLLSEAL
jgi:hypothetical protein